MIKLYCFHGGYEVTDKSIFTLGVDIGVEVKLPYQYFLIEHSNGRLMFDTGANPAAIRNPENYSPSMLFSPHVVEEDLAVNRLAGIGLKPEQSGLVPINYAREDFDLPVTYELLDGDYDVFGDQSVVLIRTPGHTRGHQSMVIRFSKDNVFILASDACYLRQNLEYMILSAVCFDQHQMYISYRRLRDLQRKENAFIIPGHDIEVWESLKKAPEFYS
jgi:hypothetical protein